jgi:fermentation-respiration switch protein FrsA (DUF1100 family)
MLAFPKPMRRLIKTLLIVAMLYLAVVAVLFFCQRTLLYHPHASKPAFGDTKLEVRRKTVCLQTADGLTLHAWYFTGERKGAPAILFMHGNSANIGAAFSVPRFLIDAGYPVMMLEYRGYSGNPGTPTEAGLIDDARAAVAYLNDHGVADSNVVLFGQSLGTGVAVRIAAEHQVRAIILRSPYTSIADVAAASFPFVPARFLVLDRFDSLALIGFNRAPLFVYHGDKDTLVPIELGRTLFSAAHQPKTWMTVQDAGHNDVQSLAAESAVLTFLSGLPPAPQAIESAEIDSNSDCGT